MAVMVKIVNANLKAPSYQPGAKGAGYGIGALGNEIERGTKTHLRLKACNCIHVVDADCGFHVVR
jgi:hypothetical protein